MKAPKHLDFTPNQVEDLIDRIGTETLAKEDYPILADLLKAIIWMNFSLQEKSLSIQRLRSIFGIKTESAKRLNKLMEEQATAAVETQATDINSAKDESSENDGQPISEPKNEPAKESPDAKKGKHGHGASSDFTEAKTIDVAHQSLKKGDKCPSCQMGRLFNLSPGAVVRIVGQPWLQVEIYKPERLRCSSCGQVFTANLPVEVMTESRADAEAKAIVSLLKYRGGVPFYRQGQIQDILGTPISASEIWEMTRDVADAAQSVYATMCECAAAAELVQNDDTKARVLSIMKDREEKKGTKQEDKRTGIFTTGILATLKDMKMQIALFFTGIRMPGKILTIF